MASAASAAHPTTEETTIATLRQEFTVNAPPALVWDVVRDFAAAHVRLAPGFISDCVLDE